MDASSRVGFRLRRETSSLACLVDVPAAAEVIIPGLLQAGAIQSARLTCKSLRQFIDENVRCLRANVSELDVCVWPSRHPPSLERWPNCCSVRMVLKPLVLLPGTAARWLTNMAALPFMCLRPAARQRVLSLQLSAPVPGTGELMATAFLYLEDAVRAAVSLLPNLQSLDLSEARAMSYSAFEQELMYRTVAMLPRLADLVLPATEALEQIGALADGPAGSSLKNLKVVCREEDKRPLTCKAVKDLSRLSCLKRIDLVEVKLRSDAADVLYRSMGVTLTELLDGLPANLQELRMVSNNGWREDYTFSLDGGRLCKLAIGGGTQDIGDLVCLAGQVLESRVMAGNPNLPNGQQQQLLQTQQPPVPSQQHPQQLLPAQQQLDELSVRFVTTEAMNDLDPEDLQPPSLAELLRCCKAVKVNQLAINSAAQLAVLADMFGKPSELLRLCSAYSIELKLRGREDSSDWAPSDPAADPGFELPSMAQVAERLVQRLIGGPAGTSKASSCGGISVGAGVGEAGGDTAGNPASSLVPAEPRRADYSSTLLLLRGGFIGLLGQAPDLVAEWVERLRAGSVELVNVPARIASYIVLPTVTEAAIIDCTTVEGAESIADVLRLLGKGQLEVLPVVSRRPREQYDEYQEGDDDFAAYVYTEKMTEVLQDIWDTRWTSGAGAALGEKEVLRRLVRLMEEVKAVVAGNRWGQDELTPFGS